MLLVSLARFLPYSHFLVASLVSFTYLLLSKYFKGCSVLAFKLQLKVCHKTYSLIVQMRLPYRYLINQGLEIGFPFMSLQM